MAHNHNPVNHPARPIYRAIGGLTGLYLVIFGVLGVVENAGEALFAQDDNLVLGQGANLGASLITAAAGVIVLAVTAIGRNVDVKVNKLLAYAFMVVALLELAVLRTDANILDFSVSTVVVEMIIGLVLLMVSMYGTVGTEEEAQAWRDGRLVL